MPFLRPVQEFSRLIKLSHTLFGLPFALSATFLADRYASLHSLERLTAAKLVLIALAFTAARSAAMGFNRLVDRDIDALNPRTVDRELVRGTISPRAAGWMIAFAVVVFVASAAALGTWPLMLSPVALVVIFAYSYFKRFSWSAHLFLGVALSIAPGAAWIAVLGEPVALQTPLLLMVCVGTWVAGFDIIYSLQDEAFDRAHRLHSIPVRFGTRGALVASAFLHIATIGALFLVHTSEQLPWPHLVGASLMSAILVYEHWIVRPSDLSRINRAFFDLNGWASVIYLVCTLAAVFLA